MKHVSQNFSPPWQYKHVHGLKKIYGGAECKMNVANLSLNVKYVNISKLNINDLGDYFDLWKSQNGNIRIFTWTL